MALSVHPSPSDAATLATAAVDKSSFLGGVTRSLNISYLRAIPLGTTVRINSKVIQAGGTMALIQGEMVSLDGRVTYATVEHHKVRVPTRPEHLKEEYEVEWDRTMKEVGLQKEREVLEGREEKVLKIAGRL